MIRKSQYAFQKAVRNEPLQDNHSPEALQKKAYQERVARETVKVFEERSAPHPHPKWAVSDALSEGSIRKEAIRRVNAQLQAERKEQAMSTQDNDNQTAMADQDIGETIKSLSEAQQKSFKAQMHAIVNEAQQRRFEARKNFAANREKLIAEAEKIGAKNPEHEASLAQRQILKMIDRQEHQQLHALFESHGWSYEKQGVSFVEDPNFKQQNGQDQTVIQKQDQGFSQ